MGTKFWVSMIVFLLGAIIVFFSLESEWSKVKGVTLKKIRLVVTGILYLFFGGWLVFIINKDEIKMDKTLNDIKQAKPTQSVTTIYVDSSKNEIIKPTIINSTTKPIEETPHLTTLSRHPNPTLLKIDNYKYIFTISTTVDEDNIIAKNIVSRFVILQKVNGKLLFQYSNKYASTPVWELSSKSTLDDSDIVIFNEKKFSDDDTVFIYYSVSFTNKNNITQKEVPRVYQIKYNYLNQKIPDVDKDTYDMIVKFVNKQKKK